MPRLGSDGVSCCRSLVSEGELEAHDQVGLMDRQVRKITASEVSTLMRFLSSHSPPTRYDYWASLTFVPTGVA